jgi:RNA polymerase-binding protein DksA
MNRAAELGSLREELERKRAVLADRVRRIDTHLRQASDVQVPSASELATVRFNDEVLEGLSAQERQELQWIESALGRFDDGSYGVCAECGVSIPTGRLRAVPFASRCVECESDN